MVSYDVSVGMGMQDNVSGTLSTINKAIEKVLKNAESFTNTVGKLNDNFGIMKTHTSQLANDLERMAQAYKDLKSYGLLRAPSVSSGKSGTSLNPAINSMRSDSGYGIDALRGSASDVENLYKRLKALPQGMEYGFIGVSERIDKIVRDLKLAHATGEQFTGVLRKMNLPSMGTGLSSAMLQAQSSYTRQLNSLKALQDSMATNGKLSVEEMTGAYRDLTSVLKDAKNVHMQMTNVMTSGELSKEQIEELNAEYQKYISNVKAVTLDVMYLGEATDVALASPELERAIQDYEEMEKQIRESAEAQAQLNAEKKAMDAILKSQERAQKDINKMIKEQETAERKAAEANKKAAREYEAIQKRLTKQGKENIRHMEEARARARAFNNELSRTNSIARNAKSGMDSLTSSIKGLAASYISLQSAQAVLNTSDSLILTEGKLSNMTKDVEGLMDNIYQMSQDTRTSYLDNASQIAKMWQLTGGTEGIFDSQDKLLQFNEVLNKGFILGGSGTREINASLYQLTQALSSGRLQGDELRSLAENAPYLINAVTNSLEKMYNEGKDQSEWIDLTYKDLKELGAQGVLTSDLIVAAVLNSTDEIRNAYKNLTPTFAQVFQTIKNQAVKISEPVLKKLNEIVNSEAFEKTAQALMKMLAVVVAALGPVIDLILWVGEVVADNWAIVEPIIWGLVGALAVYGTYLLAIKAATVAVTIASKAMAAVQFIFKGLAAMAVLYQLALGKVTWTQAKMAMSSIFASNMDAIKTKTNWGVVTSEWAKVKAMATSTTTLWGKAGATAVATGATAGLTGATWGFVGAEYAALAPILLVVGALLLVIAVIWIAVKAWNYLKDDSMTVIGAIAGATAWLAGWIWNGLLFIYNGAITVLEYILAGAVGTAAILYNIVAGIVNFVIDVIAFIVGSVKAGYAVIVNIGYGINNAFWSVAEGVANAFIWAKNQIHNAFVSLFGWLDTAMGWAVDAYNSIAEGLGKKTISFNGIIGEKVDPTEGFVDFSNHKKDYMDVTDAFMDGWDSIAKYRLDYENPLDVGSEALDLFKGTMDGWKAEYVDPDEWASKGINWGNNLGGDNEYDKYMKEAEKQQAEADKLMKEAEDALDKSKAKDNYKNSVANPSHSNLGGGGLTPDQDAAIGAVKDNTSSIADSVSTSSAELELLRELAERKAINRFTTAEIRITNNMTNTINSEMDMDGVVNYLTEELNRSLVAGSEAANHY